MMKLIELWNEDSIQAQLEGSKRNAIVFNKIARDMEAAGFGNRLLYFNMSEIIIHVINENVGWQLLYIHQ